MPSPPLDEDESAARWSKREKASPQTVQTHAPARRLAVTVAACIALLVLVALGAWVAGYSPGLTASIAARPISAGIAFWLVARFGEWGILFLVNALALASMLYLAVVISRYTQTIKRLERLLPICAACKKIRLEDQPASEPSSWVAVERYMTEQAELKFTHGLCPRCIEDLYPDLDAPLGGPE